MLSPSLSVPPSDGNPLPTSGTPSPSSRRRGLSYLRSLSSHTNPSGSGSESPRTSPRHFFTRSTSYQEAKNQETNDSRKRSRSRPNEPTTPVNAETSALARVTTIDSPATVERTASPPSEVANDPSVSSPDRDASEDRMTRNRNTTTQSDATASDGAPATRVVSATTVGGEGDARQNLPTIRFFPHQDPRATRQSLNFPPVSRTLPTEKSIIRVGRYSEREGPPNANPTHPSDAPVGFKSKVVSRRHCEFCFVDGQWQIKDVASSSGTFLNHIRLSQPNQESRLYPIKDGDIVQLGIDFRGGEEMIFRCVKIRIECNRSWQKKPNTFNKTRQAQLRGLTKDQPSANSNSGECAICLGGVLPCQALFVAPCAHVWHYKCIRPMLEGKSSQYPHFQCPNCRAWSDLEAEVEIAESDMDEWLEESGERDGVMDIDQTDRGKTPELSNDAPATATESSTITPTAAAAAAAAPTPAEPASNTQLSPASSGLLARRQATSQEAQAVNTGISMPEPPNEETMRDQLAQQRTQTESPNAEQIIAGEGPLTPRNNAGPFVFDGSGSAARLGLNPSQSISEVSDN